MTTLISQWWPSFAGFAWPWAFALLPLPWLAAWLLPPRRAATAALKVPFADALPGLAQGGRAAAWRMPWLAVLAWWLLCVALARPQELGEAVVPPQSGRNLMLALDLSGSMREADMQLGSRVVDRLTAAKAVLADFLDRREGDRVGLLVFGQRAYALSPLTQDRESVREQLADTVSGLAGQETAIGDAIGLAVKRLRQQREGQRVLILLTDGVNTAGLLTPAKAAELAAAEHVRVHTVAFGSEGGTLSLFGLKLPSAGNEDAIDEKTLRAIAEKTGGRFFRARDTAELAGIYSELDRIEPVEQAGQAVRPRIERYADPLLAALCVALLSLLWPRRVLQRLAARALHPGAGEPRRSSAGGEAG
ncbi:vWA domain-containing protein [Pseudoxanthomonas composti]|uniref:VWA domain-containing protein n=1 Tax=Pseudoxanthomonas composti TaxID=2137479 RepID=A0A4Q1JTI4_9GAMM|nr:VWA domain-containing protein [Pseudoxanthomonas composti]RXR04278.1 VWA domain-containing protein [Pseudoxanthomonas composti]